MHVPIQDAMGLALSLAEHTAGLVQPNPPVGAVLVPPNTQPSAWVTGHHGERGLLHAEAVVFDKATSQQCQNAVLFVTLEPCCHHGKTPPCTEAIIASGVRTVVFAALDPNPLVAGQGMARLQQAGLEVVCLQDHPEYAQLTEAAIMQQQGFRSRMLRGRPWLTYKYASTLDGYVCDTQKHSQWITTHSRARAQQLRADYGVVAFGGGTVATDNPKAEGVRAVVFDRHGRYLTPQHHLWREGTIVVGEAVIDGPVTTLQTHTLHEALQGLGAMGINQVLLEGGPTLATALWQAGLIDQIEAHIAPKLLGAGIPALHAQLSHIGQAQPLYHVHNTSLNNEVQISGLLQPLREVFNV